MKTLFTLATLLLWSLSFPACERTDAPENSPNAAANDEEPDPTPSESPKASDDGQGPTPSPSQKVITKHETVIKKTTIEVELLYKEADAKTFLQAECSSCHLAGGSAAGSWEFRADSFSADTFADDPKAPAVYQAIVNTLADNPTSRPSPMPPAGIDLENEETVAGYRAMLGWFHADLPLVVFDANLTFGTTDATRANAVAITFACAEPISRRQFLNRFTFAAFDRPPNTEEWATLSDLDLEEPVTMEDRKAVVGLLATQQSEFLTTGLRKLTDAISGAGSIADTGDYLEITEQDLRQEFYQLVKKYYTDWSYDRFFTSDRVAVSANTALLYGCQDPEGDWGDCILSSPRGGFFSTIGFLASHPSSFLLENNNYHRAASMYHVLFAEGVTAATDGPTGSQDNLMLPECFTDNDHRYRGGGPRGASAIPLFGATCYGCHIGKNLATGSVLFRPFSKNGKLYVAGTIDDVDQAEFSDALGNDWMISADAASAPVDAAHLDSLLTASPDVCVKQGDKYAAVNSVKQMTTEMLKEPRWAMAGLAQHSHRAFLNGTERPLDVFFAMTESYDKGERSLAALLQQYFLSESFSCGTN